MKIIYSDDHRFHAGAREMVYGELVAMFGRTFIVCFKVVAQGFVFFVE